MKGKRCVEGEKNRKSAAPISRHTGHCGKYPCMQFLLASTFVKYPGQDSPTCQKLKNYKKAYFDSFFGVYVLVCNSSRRILLAHNNFYDSTCKRSIRSIAFCF